MPLSERTGDLFEADEPALAHGCNCAGAMGKGIAVEFKRRWPDMYERYRDLCHNGEFNPGDVFTWTGPDKVIFNLGTQRTWRTKATLEFLRASVARMIDDARQHDIAAIAMPRIAAGLGGLGWDDVRDALVEIAPDDIEIVVYSPTN